MMKAAILALACLTVCLGGTADATSWLEKLSLYRQRLWNRVDIADLSKFDLDDDPQAKYDYLVQPMDHFDPKVKKHFKQHYWIIDKYWKSSSHPVFLYIGGETALVIEEVANGHHVEMAKAHGALILGVEHRFYGYSITKEGLYMRELQHLSSQQELADLAAFRVYAEKKLGMSGNNTWISIGGSYAGDLSAWLRLKYPHLIYGSVASSAPVRAVVNFEGYNEVVAASFGDPIVFGSKQCITSITQAFAKVGQMLQAGQHAQLKKDFNTCQDLTDPDDVTTFASYLGDRFMGFVQYNEVAGNKSNIGDVCKLMMVPDPYQALAKMFNQSKNCFDVSYADFIQRLENTTQNPGSIFRQWFYQTCTQFGLYQTCDKNTTCMFLPQMDLAYYLKWCKDAYDIPAKEVMEQVDFTNAYYGADNPRGSRVVFVDGTIDPWHVLSVLKDLPESLKSVFIKGTSHCEDMLPSKPDDTPALKAGRLAIEKEVSSWLQQAEMEKRRK